MTTALQNYINRRSTFPSLFSNDGYLDDILQNITEPTKWYYTQTAYPYNVEEFVDNLGNIQRTILTIALAGKRKEDIEMKIVDNTLHISVNKGDIKRAGDDTGSWRSAYTGISNRAQKYTFRLHDVDEDNITSRFENGLLEVTFPAVKHKELTINID